MLFVNKYRGKKQNVPPINNYNDSIEDPDDILTVAKSNMRRINQSMVNPVNMSYYATQQPNIQPNVGKDRFKLVKSVPFVTNMNNALYDEAALTREYDKKTRQVTVPTTFQNSRVPENRIDSSMNINTAVRKTRPITNFELFQESPFIYEVEPVHASDQNIDSDSESDSESDPESDPESDDESKPISQFIPGIRPNILKENVGEAKRDATFGLNSVGDSRRTLKETVEVSNGIKKIVSDNVSQPNSRAENSRESQRAEVVELNSKDVSRKNSKAPVSTSVDAIVDYRKYMVDGREVKYEGYVASKTVDTNIPLVCYTVWHSNTLPPKMQANYDRLCEMNPDIRFELFDEDKCRKFIDENYDKDVLDAYDRLVPSSYKSDLWRFCILHRYGGIYMDIKYITTNGFRLIELCEKEHFVLDRDNYWENNQMGIYTALISVQPRNKILRACIQQITHNTENYYYGYNALYPTGPGLLGSVFFENEFAQNIHRMRDIELFHIETSNSIVYKNTVVLAVYDGYRDEQSVYQNNLHYSHLWSQRAIYNMNFKVSVDKKPVKMSSYLPRVCCICHIGSYHVFQKMKHYVDNLVSAQYDAYNLDIYFNIIDTFTKDDISSLKKAYPNENIIISENYGFDIGSFFHTLEIIKQKKITYDFVLKIHTKTHNTTRVNLLEPILGSIAAIRNIFAQFDSKPNVGIIAARNGRCIDAHVDFTRNQSYLQQLVHWYFKETTNICKQPYVSGTIFWMRFHLVEELFMKYSLPNIYNSMNNIHTFDWNWYYHSNNKHLGSTTLNRQKLYEHYIQHGKALRLSGNIFHAIKYNTNSIILRDGMVEHAYERFFCYGIHRLGYQLYFIT